MNKARAVRPRFSLDHEGGWLVADFFLVRVVGLAGAGGSGPRSIDAKRPETKR